MSKPVAVKLDVLPIPPHCAHCDKQLRPFTRSHSFNGVVPARVAEIHATTHHRNVTKYATAIVPGTIWGYHYTTGNFGYRGNNRFCSKTCGYLWALDKLKPRA